MSRSLALSLNGNSSIINTNFFPPIELNGRHECALIDFNMYNSIPNIDEKNSLFHIGDKVITIPTGSYELNDITDFIYNKLKDYNLENTFKIQSNYNTLQVEITTMRDSVYFIKERSVGQLFGFHQKVLEPHPTKTYRSDQTVNILN